MCNEDTALTSRTAWRLYKRVVYEVDVRNYIHQVPSLILKKFHGVVALYKTASSFTHIMCYVRITFKTDFTK